MHQKHFSLLCENDDQGIGGTMGKLIDWYTRDSGLHHTLGAKCKWRSHKYEIGLGTVKNFPFPKSTEKLLTGGQDRHTKKTFILINERKGLDGY